MELDITTFLIVCPLVFLGGFVDSIAGGGGLITLPAYLIAGLPPHYAIATNKLSAAIGSGVSVYRLWRGSFVHFTFLMPAIVAAIIGAAVGSQLLLVMDEIYLQYLLLIILPITAFYVLRKKSYDDKIREVPHSRAITTAISFVLSAYCGFYGPGTGAFLILVLISWAGMNVRTAAGSAKVINVAANFAALAVLMLSGKVLVTLGLVAAAFGMAGNYIGSGMLIHKGATIIRPIIIFVLAIFFAKVIYDMFVI
ncbi:MAG: TSUP family transporter [Deferribacteraceae bacterium]|jgi:uncharacterized membrane protein YfcA|nr:TSUP family transporter [Deferribacteraceae bacterium]